MHNIFSVIWHSLKSGDALTLTTERNGSATGVSE